MSRIFLISIFLSNLFSNQIYYEYGKKIELTPITQDKYKSIPLTQNSQDSNNSIKYYEKSNAQIVGVDNTILAKSLDDDGCEEILQNYNTLEFKTISKNIYLIYLKNQDEIFDISVKLYEEGCFEYVHPNFYKEKKSR